MPKPKFFINILLLISLFFAFSCRKNVSGISEADKTNLFPNARAKSELSEIKSSEIKRMLESAMRQTEITKTYDPAYIVIPYPNGDVPPETGVCSDVVIRAFRAAGVDLQRAVHEDMRGNFSLYPKKWNLPKPDTNIDHRRVPNLQTFFERKGKSLPITQNSDDYLPGDVVSWDLNGKGMTHIGVVSNIFSGNTKRYLIIHNIGAGTKAEDVLFDWKVTGHFRYF